MKLPNRQKALEFMRLLFFTSAIAVKTSAAPPLEPPPEEYFSVYLDEPVSLGIPEFGAGEVNLHTPKDIYTFIGTEGAIVRPHLDFLSGCCLDVVIENRNNGQVLFSGDSSLLNSLPPLALSAGPYTITFSHSGSDWSVEYGFTLTDLTPPSFLAQPQSVVCPKNGKVFLDPEVSGGGALSFQWKRNGDNVPGATDRQLVISSVSGSTAGEYRLFVQSDYGSAISEPAVVSVDDDEVAWTFSSSHSRDFRFDSKTPACVSPDGGLFVIADLGYLTKLRPDGTLEWEYSFSDGWEGRYQSIALSSAGEPLLLIGGPSSVALHKLTIDGHPVWVKQLPDIAIETVQVLGDANGSILVLLKQSSIKPGQRFSDTDVLLIKYDPEGNELWRREFDSGNRRDDTPVNVIANAAGEIFISVKAGLSLATPYLLKFSPSGDLHWASTSGVFSRGVAGAELLPNGDIAMASTDRTGAIRVEKFNPSGSLAWSKADTFDHFSTFATRRIGIDLNGNIYAMGSGMESRIVRFSPSGEILWSHQVPDALFSDSEFMVVHNDGTLLYLGIGSSSHASTDLMVLKYDSLGMVQWRAYLGAADPQNEIPRALTGDRKGTAYITASSFIPSSSGIIATRFHSIKSVDHPSPVAPVVTWNSPAPIIYGTVLGPVQLNAAANTPGVFNYSPAEGTALNAGPNQILSASFIPADATKYLSVQAGTSLDVLPAPLVITAENKVMEFGDPLPLLTAIYQGFVNGESMSALSQPAVLATSATIGSAPGVYTISVHGALGANYDVWFIGGILTVTPPAQVKGIARPGSIIRSRPTTVTVSMYVPRSPALLPTTVNLQRFIGSTWTVVGTMYDDGTNGDSVAGDNVFSLTRTLTENEPGIISFRGSVGYKGILKRSLSSTFTITVGN